MSDANNTPSAYHNIVSTWRDERKTQDDAAEACAGAVTELCRQVRRELNAKTLVLIRLRTKGSSVRPVWTVLDALEPIKQEGSGPEDLDPKKDKDEMAILRRDGTIRLGDRVYLLPASADNEADAVEKKEADAVEKKEADAVEKKEADAAAAKDKAASTVPSRREVLRSWFGTAPPNMATRDIAKIPGSAAPVQAIGPDAPKPRLFRFHFGLGIPLVDRAGGFDPEYLVIPFLASVSLAPDVEKAPQRGKAFIWIEPNLLPTHGTPAAFERAARNKSVVALTAVGGVPSPRPEDPPSMVKSAVSDLAVGIKAALNNPKTFTQVMSRYIVLGAATRAPDVREFPPGYIKQLIMGPIAEVIGVR